ncbi:MAG: prohibitin 1 [Bacteroidia bacterium]|jgi:prohibitin 1
MIPCAKLKIMAQNYSFNKPNLGGLKIGWIFLILFFVIILFKSTITIRSGKAGVLYKTFGGGVETERT